MKFVILLACVASISAAVLENKPKGHDDRLINGAEIPISEAPYQVSVQTKAGAHKCGGTIIGANWVLTTAECAQGVTSATHQIRYNTNIHNWGGFTASVSKVYIYSRYQPGRYEANIALIKTLESFLYSTYSTVVLRCPGAWAEKEPYLVAGWGAIMDNSGLLSAKLRQVTLPYAGWSCSEYYYNSLGISVNSDMFCAGNLETGGSGICVGDEGGAAVKRVNGRNIIAGIASYQYKCGEPYRVSLFSDVSYYRFWLLNVMNTTAYCYN